MKQKMFQSSPGLSTGCNLYNARIFALVTYAVSILTRPFDRVQRRQNRGSALPLLRFNPHPAFRPGATRRPAASPTASGGFNPHPAFRPGATPCTRSAFCSDPVSILTRPFDRVQRPPSAPYSPIKRGFNPHPAFRPGATRRPAASPTASGGFNPHPAFRPGATPCTRSAFCSDPVSILTRPFDRVQLGQRAISAKRPRFNPHPAFRPGATFLSWYAYNSGNRFQSSPGLSTGCNNSVLRHLRQGRQFQSPPGLSTGCNHRACYRRVADALFQSSPGLSTGCNGVFCIGVIKHRPQRFNPHPAFRPGATCVRSLPTLNCRCVSILTRPFDRVQLVTAGTSFTFADLFQSSPGLSTGCNG